MGARRRRCLLPCSTVYPPGQEHTPHWPMAWGTVTSQHGSSHLLCRVRILTQHGMSAVVCLLICVRRVPVVVLALPIRRDGNIDRASANATS